jgi:hypothetical protein
MIRLLDFLASIFVRVDVSIAASFAGSLKTDTDKGKWERRRMSRMWSIGFRKWH